VRSLFSLQQQRLPTTETIAASAALMTIATVTLNECARSTVTIETARPIARTTVSGNGVTQNGCAIGAIAVMIVFAAKMIAIATTDPESSSFHGSLFRASRSKRGAA